MTVATLGQSRDSTEPWLNTPFDVTTILRYNIHEYMNTYSTITHPRAAALDDEDTVHLAELFKALGDPTRLRLIAALAPSEQCVGDLATALAMSESAVSHQLRTLRQLRLVRARKAGRQVYYALDDEHIAELFQRGLDHVRHD